MEPTLANAPPSSPTAVPLAHRAALGGISLVVVLLALVKLALHAASTGRYGYGFFIDELYFLACSEHLAWGFVDMPPLFPAVTALVRAILGDSLWAVRLVPMLSGAGLVLLTGLIARDLGGRRLAQGMAALAVVAAPLWLALHSLHTMNALEQLFWTVAAWLVLRIVRDDRPRLWLAFGAVCGLGLLNKHSMAFFGVALVVGLLLTPERRAFRSRWLWLGGLVAGLLFLPNFLWDFRHGFPHFEMLRNIKADGRDVQLSPLAFLAQQAFLFNPVALPLWLGGLGWFLFDREGRRYRVLGIAFLAALAEMFLLDGRVYYLAPAYPMLFAAGGVALERWIERGGAPAEPNRRRWLGPAYAALLAVAGLVLAPLSLPILPPETLIRYTRALGFSQPRIENHRLGPLPQLMADRFGWPEMAAEVARVYRTLPPAEQAKAAIFGQNYGQAGAIDHFGPALGLPKAISGHLTYFLWGPRGYTGEVMIVLDDNRQRLEELFSDVELSGHVSHPYSMPYEHFDVWICRGPRTSLPALWPQLKQYH
jgi:Dolichyl-phosphate-mannose-protein mannosyltransferase